MNKNTKTFEAQDNKTILDAIQNIQKMKNIQTLVPNSSIDILVSALMNCHPKLKGDFISMLRIELGDAKFGSLQIALHFKKFETTINGLVKGKKLDFEDKGSEFILRDGNNAILQGMSKDSEETVSKAFDYLENKIHKRDPLQLMTLINKLVASEFGQNVMTKNPDLVIKYQRVKDQIVQAIADALHARAASIFNKITSEELQDPSQYSDPKKCPNLIAMDLFISGLTLATAEVILGADHELDLRTLQLHDLIEVGGKLASMGSFNAFMGVFVGLTTTHIHRLKNTWEGLSIHDKDLFRKFEVLMDPRGNKKTLRNEQLSQKIRGTRIQPQLAILKSDIIYARDGNLNKDGSLDIEIYQKTIQSMISFCLDLQPSEVLEPYKGYDRPEFYLTPRECKRKTETLLKISMILEPKKKDETPVSSKIISNLNSSGKVLTLLAKNIYTQMPHSPRARSSSVSEKPKCLEKIEQQKYIFFKELLSVITEKKQKVETGKKETEIFNKRKSEYQTTKQSPGTLFHRRTKSLLPTPDNALDSPFKVK